MDEKNHGFIIIDFYTDELMI